MNNQNTIKLKLDKGLKLHQAGLYQQAQRIYRDVLCDDAKNPDAHHFLGLIAHQEEQYGEAIRLIQQAIEFSQNRPTFHFNLGASLLKLGNTSDAKKAYQIAVTLKSDWPEAHYALGIIEGMNQRFLEAAERMRTAIKLRPNYPEALSSMAAALNNLDKPEEAIIFCKRAIAFKDKMPESWTNLGNAQEKLKNFDEAERAHQEAIKNCPDYAPGYYNIGNLHAEFWQPKQATKFFKKALKFDATHCEARDNLLQNALYDEQHTEKSLFNMHLRWSEATHTALTRSSFENSKRRNRKLRIGYVSPDFRRHSCAYFILPLIKHHDRNKFECFAYSNVSQSDEITTQIKSIFDHWNDISRLQEIDAHKCIIKDRIDILVDLAGYTLNNSLGVFAKRSAPVQVAWLGYPSTTGLTTIDYRLTDQIADPIGEADKFHTEQLIRIPGSFLCYSQPETAVNVLPSPKRNGQFIRFGSFNNPRKITKGLVKLWAEILHGVNGSKLLLKGKSLRVPQTRKNIINAFAQYNIKKSQLELVEWLPNNQNPINFYNQIDIALDTFPYNGTTTTFEALWMGVPVITLMGQRHAGRVGSTIMSTLGLNELISVSPTDYRNNAIRLANSPQQLELYKTELRATLSSSPLMDGPSFTSKIERVFQKMWNDWCQNQNN